MLKTTRSYLYIAIYPIHWCANLPIQLLHTAKNKLLLTNHLVAENRNLNQQILELKAELQQQDFLFSQNNLLQQLLHATKTINTKNKVLMANIISIDPQNISHKIVINCGSEENITAGQAVIDAHGIFGQVIEVSKFCSRVLLISDSMTRVPAQNNRTGYRTIVSGTGNYQTVNLLQVPTTADFKMGDLIISSGIDTIYPEGYPIGTVKEIIHEQNNPFLTIKVRLSAKLEFQQPLLLVFSTPSNTDIM